MAIDWDKPIERLDGTKLYIDDIDRSDMTRWVVPIGAKNPANDGHWYNDAGSAMLRSAIVPPLRNVPEPAAQPLYDRMLALVERIARDEVVANAEARAIMAELRPVDPDLIEARKIAAETLNRLGASAEQIAAGEIGNGQKDDAIVVHATLAAIKRGRELAVQP